MNVKEENIDEPTEEELKYWEERAREPIKAVLLSEEELEELRKEGLI